MSERSRARAERKSREQLPRQINEAFERIGVIGADSKSGGKADLYMAGIAIADAVRVSTTIPDYEKDEAPVLTQPEDVRSLLGKYPDALLRQYAALAIIASKAGVSDETRLSLEQREALFDVVKNFMESDKTGGSWTRRTIVKDEVARELSARAFSIRNFDASPFVKQSFRDDVKLAKKKRIISATTGDGTSTGRQLLIDAGLKRSGKDWAIKLFPPLRRFMPKEPTMVEKVPEATLEDLLDSDIQKHKDDGDNNGFASA